MLTGDHDLAAVQPPETRCANCGAQRVARFCPQCGQDSTRAIESITAFLRRVLSEVSDLEGPLWRTLSFILRRPGVLAREYFERRFHAQISPVRLYLAIAAASYLILPVLSAWMNERSVNLSFVSPFGLAVTVPIWATLVQATLVGKKRYYEEVFTFSAHYHTWYLIVFTMCGLGTSALLLMNVPVLGAAAPLVLFMFLFAPAYLLVALRTAFGLGWLRSTVTTLLLSVGHAYLLNLINGLLGGITPP